jgi:hypothetical protein
MEAFESGLEWVRSTIVELAVLNAEIKILVRQRPEATLSPIQITDRDVFLAYDNDMGRFRWGLALRGRRYVTLFAQWFDDRWSSIPHSYLIYSLSGLNQKAVELVRREIEANEAARSRVSK